MRKTDKPIIDLGAVRHARLELEKFIRDNPKLTEPEAQERLAALFDDESALDVHAQRRELSQLFDKLGEMDNHGLDSALSDDDRIDFTLKLNKVVANLGKEDDGENENED